MHRSRKKNKIRQRRANTSRTARQARKAIRQQRREARTQRKRAKNRQREAALRGEHAAHRQVTRTVERGERRNANPLVAAITNLVRGGQNAG